MPVPETPESVSPTPLIQAAVTGPRRAGGGRTRKHVKLIIPPLDSAESRVRAAQMVAEAVGRRELTAHEADVILGAIRLVKAELTPTPEPPAPRKGVTSGPLIKLELPR